MLKAKGKRMLKAKAHLSLTADGSVASAAAMAVTSGADGWRISGYLANGHSSGENLANVSS